VTATVRPADLGAGTETVSVAGASRLVVAVVNTATVGDSKKPGLCIGTTDEVAQCKAALFATGSGGGGGAGTGGGGAGDGDETGGDGCGCAVAGASGSAPTWALGLGVAGVAMALGRRRRPSSNRRRGAAQNASRRDCQS
jgi:MYXO-CTERM domain-containing protein